VPITFYCSECTQKLRIDDSFAGKKVACVRCGSRQRVPEESQPPPAGRKGVRPDRPRRKPEKSERTLPEVPAYSEPEPAEPEPLRFAEFLEEEATPEPAAVELPVEPPVFERPPLPSEEPTREPEVGEVPLFDRLFDEPAEKVSEPDPEPEQPEPDEPEPALPHRAPIEYTEIEQVAAPEELKPEPVPAVTGGPRRMGRTKHVEAPLVMPQRKLDLEELIDMTAMVDIVFFLLIFFLVTSMNSLDSSIPMPAPDPQKGAAREPKSIDAIDADDSYVVVRIDRNDKISVEGSEVRSDRDLMFKLRDHRLGSAHPDKLLVIGHGDATHGTVVMVLDAGRDLGMDQVRLTVQDEEQ
jgi:biopolymer transport protein ExbD